MERKIYADNALDCLNRLGKGIMNDGDEKMNASIVDTACASLPAELCERIHTKMGELCKEETEKSGALPAEKMSELNDLRNVLQHMEKLNWRVCLSGSFLVVSLLLREPFSTLSQYFIYNKHPHLFLTTSCSRSRQPSSRRTWPSQHASSPGWQPCS